MKKIFAFLPILLAFTSCNKANSDYPTHITGSWAYQSGSTGELGLISIEDISGGQYASLLLLSPTKEIEDLSLMMKEPVKVIFNQKQLVQRRFLFRHMMMALYYWM